MNQIIEVTEDIYITHKWEDACIQVKKIPLKDLYDKNIYDIDHIYPRSR